MNVGRRLTSARYRIVGCELCSAFGPRATLPEETIVSCRACGGERRWALTDAPPGVLALYLLPDAPADLRDRARGELAMRAGRASLRFSVCVEPETEDERRDDAAWRMLGDPILVREAPRAKKLSLRSPPERPSEPAP